jgi:hypothetical protein
LAANGSQAASLYELALRGEGWNLSDVANKDWIPVVATKKKRSSLPLLVVVFLVSYGLMTLLIVEQGKTIQSQHNLIEVLLVDSTELWSLKGKAQVEKFQAQAQAQAQSHSQTPAGQAPLTHGLASPSETPSTQAPLTTLPSTQAPISKTPSSQVPSKQVPSHPVQHQLQNHTGKAAKPAPQMQLPPMPASDLGDQRRVLITL